MTGGVVVRRLSKVYDGRAALRNASLTAPRGSFVALLGPSGAGKTTLLRCLARLVAPDAGEAYVDGRPMHALSGRALREARARIGFVFQDFNLVRRRSALDNALGGVLASTPLWRVALGRPRPADARSAMAALDRVGLGDRAGARADELSGGQRQRVAIARALVQDTAVLLADEPVASLDPDSAAGVLALLKDLTRERGLTVLCSLHQHHLAHAYADEIVRLAPPEGEP
ncbi:phosphonate ABC transporter ATP-binding protein [Methylopila sp. Yamaguchi]|uniref:phosphonate ABC transporter ATP-binding protein n=1 Tax=Methylopila sp. Yamaguchi TaxID=1437817 RepID=UPI000CB11031|nr:phosphonate ABC transporter ATP-binding protein [Methylopila sp. Yamaguchi]GBD48157.1 phosphonate ABC transporter ATP-binding protein [Methylopila sp. Yamaguchi]